MSEILNLALPFFGLILLGVFASRRWQASEEGLAWLNIFLVYFSLPALIFLVVAKSPFEQLLNWPFVTATTSVTIFAFLAVVVASRWLFATPLKTAALQGTSGSYGNVGYMGLPLAVAFFGPEAAVPAALVFCFAERLPKAAGYRLHLEVLSGPLPRQRAAAGPPFNLPKSRRSSKTSIMTAIWTTRSRSQ